MGPEEIHVVSFCLITPLKYVSDVYNWGLLTVVRKFS